MKFIQLEDWKVNPDSIAYYHPKKYWEYEATGQASNGVEVGFVGGSTRVFKITMEKFEDILNPPGQPPREPAKVVNIKTGRP